MKFLTLMKSKNNSQQRHIVIISKGLHDWNTLRFHNRDYWKESLIEINSNENNLYFADNL